MFTLIFRMVTPLSTASRKNFTTVQDFIAEPESRDQVLALGENVKEFGVTFFGISDKRQGQLPSSRFVFLS